MPKSNEIQELRRELDDLKRLVNFLVRTDRYVFARDLQIEDNRNIRLSGTTGSRIGTASTQKMGFFGGTPIVRPSAVSIPTITGSDSDASARQAISDLYNNVIKALGLSA